MALQSASKMPFGAFAGNLMRDLDMEYVEYLVAGLNESYIDDLTVDQQEFLEWAAEEGVT